MGVFKAVSLTFFSRCNLDLDLDLEILGLDFRSRSRSRSVGNMGPDRPTSIIHILQLVKMYKNTSSILYSLYFIKSECKSCRISVFVGLHTSLAITATQAAILLAPQADC